MMCPKCGFDQPDAYECVKCGVVIAKYMSVLKKKEETESKFTPGVASVPAPPAEDPAREPIDADSSDPSEDINRISGELDCLRQDKNHLKDELTVLQKRVEDLTQVISERAPASHVQQIKQQVTSAYEHLNAFKVSLVEMAKFMEKIKGLPEEFKTLISEVERVKMELSKSIGKNTELDEIKRNLISISREVEAMKNDRQPGLLSDGEGGRLFTDLKSEIESIKTEIANLLQSRTVDKSQFLNTSFLAEVGELKGELEILKSEIKKLILDKDRGKRGKADGESLQADLARFKKDLETMMLNMRKVEQVEVEVKNLKNAWSSKSYLRDQQRDMRVNSGNATANNVSVAELPLDVRELKDDIKTVKLLLMDLMKKS